MERIRYSYCADDGGNGCGDDGDDDENNYNDAIIPHENQEFWTFLRILAGLS